MIVLLRTALIGLVLAVIGVSLHARSLPSLTPETGREKQENPCAHKPDENQDEKNIAIQRKLANFTLCLVVVGIIQAAILAFTICAIRGQTKTIQNTERAWVMAQIDGDREKWYDGKIHIVLGSGASGDSTSTWIVLSCHNEGKSPGWIYEKRMKLEVVSKVDPAPDFDSFPVAFTGREPIGIGQAGVPNVTELPRVETAEGHAKSDEVMVVCGIVKYHDIFGKKRTTTFGYRIIEGTKDYTLERLSETPYNNNT
jgi:hypothetical protein